MMSRLTILLLATVTSVAFAQPPGGNRGGGERGRQSTNAVLSAIDANGDHEITTDEMKNAFASLQKLDTDKDGKLVRSEIHPEMAGRGGGGRGGERGERGGANRTDLGKRLNGLDKNKDGTLSNNEIPARMERMVSRFDANKDGALDKGELAKMTEQLSEAGPERDGRGGDRRGGPGEGGAEHGGGRGGPPTAEQVVSDALSFDANKDGMLSKAELQKFAEEHARRGPSGGGPGGGRGEGGPGGGGDEDRPQRPSRPE